MTEIISTKTKGDDLRPLAEEKLKADRGPVFNGQSEDVQLRLLHELQVHQVELQMQNTELLQTRHDLEKLLGKYTDLYESAPAGYLTLDRSGKILQMNLSASRLLGHERSRLKNMRFAEFVAEEDRPVMASLFNDVFSQPNNVSCELVLLQKENLPRFVKIEALADSSGQECQLVLIDISERKKAESYRTMGVKVLQALNEPGDLQDSLTQIIKVLKNGTGFDAVGIRLQEGDDFPYFAQDGFPTDLLLKENSLLERSINGGVCRDQDGDVCLECTCGLVLTGKGDLTQPFFTAGGSFLTNDSFPLLHLPEAADPRLHPRNECIHHDYASVALVPIRCKNRIVGLIQFNDRRKDQFTLNSLQILESISAHIGAAMLRKQAERDQARLQEQLQQAQKIESIGQLAGGVAHDFNNMLGVILGNAELALIQADPANPFVEALVEIRTAAKRSADLTRQLLTFARKQAIAPKVLDLNETVAGMLKMLQRLIGENINLSWNPKPNLWAVKIDPAQLDQIIANLCVNARDAIAGIGQITIETENCSITANELKADPETQPGDYVRLSVSDDGHGIDEENLSQIFEPFFTTKELGQGTGLGLSTVYGAVKQNHGFIEVVSELGQGTTFHIYLPRQQAHIKTEEEITAKALVQGTETVLLVEDDQMLLKLTKIMLEKNGKDLRDILLVIKPEMKVIFISGYSADTIAKQGVLEEGINFLQKPVSFEALTTKVREVLDSDS